MLKIASLIVSIPYLAFAGAASPASSGPTLTRIDATKAIGMTIVASSKGLTLETLDGSVAKIFPCDMKTLKITSGGANTWTLKDKHGAGLSIADQEPRYLVVVNRGYKTVKVTKIGTPITPVSVPIHAWTIINQVNGPLSIEIADNHSVHTQATVDRPVTMVCPYVGPDGKTVNSNFGTFAARTDFGFAAKPAR